MGVDVKQLKNAAEDIHTRGEKIGNNISKIYESIKLMQNYWTGESYRAFVSVVNTMEDDFNRINKYFAKTLPTELYKKRKAILKASGSKKTEAIPTFKIPAKVANIKITNKSDEIEFKEEKINTYENQIKTSFNEIQNQLKTILDEFLALKWGGTSGSLMKKMIKSRINTMSSALKELSKAMSNNITATKKAMKKVDDSNSTSDESDNLGNTTNTSKATSELSKIAADLDSSDLNWERMT